ncbi:PAS domain-containing protein [Pseudomonas fragi]|uniref:Sensory box histidine kinase/response regulator n=1 Tax=Pseudomonas fragi TaxID=296 RepID=A0A449ISE1_PSEFR|nr:PAS domain-containing protein [Pseudomonas fragi]VFB22295.1 sensory box histidine kinase/response regulator [Pseudomonas fragi]
MKSDVYYKAIFEASPALYIVVDTDWNIVAVSDSYLKAAMLKREDILGKNVFEVLPDNPDAPEVQGTAAFRASLERVVKSGDIEYMPIQRYDVQSPAGFVKRYWMPLNAPVFDEHGKVIYCIHGVEDVTNTVK